MKIFALAFVLLVGNAFAEVPEIMASKMTCAELKENLKNYGSVIVVKKILLFKKRILVHQTVDCDSDETKNYGFFKTTNARSCQVGEFCVADPVYSSSSDYSSGSSYDSGSYSGSSYDSGSSYSGSSSSGSSSSGSHYDPPSSGTRGDNYNPPSSGERGPRYCPGC